MSKKDDIKLDKNIDTDIDDLFQDDLGLDDEDFFEDMGDERDPLSIENLKKAAKNEIKKPPTLDEIGRAIDRTMPPELNPEYNIIKETFSSTKDLINKNFTNLKKEMSPMVKLMGKMNQEYLNDNKIIKTILEKLTPDETYKYRGPSLDEEVEEVLKATFASQEEIQTKLHGITQTLEENRTASTNELLKNIYKEASILRTYTTDISSPYQKKSLELQYKSTIYLKEILDSYRVSSKEQVEMLKGIIKNTGLPDVVKQRDSEMLGAELKMDMRRRVLDKFVHNNPLLTNLKRNIGNKVSGFFNSASSMVQDLSMAVDMAALADGVDYNKLVASLGKEKALEFMAKYGGNKLAKLPMGVKAIGKMKRFFDSPELMFNNWADKIEGSGFLSNTGRSLLHFMGDLTKDRSKLTSSLNTARYDLDMATTLDMRTKLAINRVIPGYLRKIHAEIKAHRLKFKGDDVSKFELTYHHDQDKFVSRSSLGDILKRNIASHMTQSMDYSLDRMKRQLKRSGADVSEENLDQIAKYLSIAATKTSASGVQLLKARSTEKLIPTHLKSDFDKLVGAVEQKYETDLDYVEGLRYSVDSLRSSIPNVMKFFEDMLKDGNYDILLDMGIIEYDEHNNTFRPIEANILKTMYACYGLYDEESFQNATQEMKSDGIKLGKWIRKYVLKGKRSFNQLNKTLRGDKSTRDQLKKEIEDSVKNLSSKTKSMFKNMKSYISSKTSKKPEDSVKDFKDKLNELKETHLSDLTSKSRKEESRTRMNTQTEDEYTPEELENIDQVLREKETEVKAVKLIDAALQSGTEESIQEVERVLQEKNLDTKPIVSKKLKKAKTILKEKKQLGSDLLKQTEKIKDPEEKNFTLMKLLSSGLGIIPYGGILKSAGKGLWWLFKRGWKNELWLAKNVYWPMLKGIGSLPFKMLGLGGTLAKYGGKGLLGLGGLLGGAGVKATRGLVSGGINSMSRLLFGTNLIGDNIWGGKKQKKSNSPQDNTIDDLKRRKERFINGMTEEEFKKKGKRTKKKQGWLSKLFGMLTKIGGGLLAAITGLSGSVMGLAKKAIPALLTGISGLGGKLFGMFKGSKLFGGGDLPIDDIGGNRKNPKKPKKGIIAKIKNAIRGMKDKLFGPISKKVGKATALKVVGKLSQKLLGFIAPLGLAFLAYSAGSIMYNVYKGQSLQSSICSELLGFDPWDENDPVLDENGNPVQPEKEEDSLTPDEVETTSNQTIPGQLHQLDNTSPKNVEEYIQAGIKPATPEELTGWTTQDVNDLRKEEAFQLLTKKSSQGEITLTEEQKARSMLLEKKKEENGWVPGNHGLLVKMGREVDQELFNQRGSRPLNTNSVLSSPTSERPMSLNPQPASSVILPSVNVNVDTDGIIKSQADGNERIVSETQKTNELLAQLLKLLGEQQNNTQPVSYTPQPTFNMNRNLSK